MSDYKILSEALCRDKGCNDVKIASCSSSSGKAKELLYCPVDRCFYVTVGGRERLRSDMEATAYNYYARSAEE